MTLFQTSKNEKKKEKGTMSGRTSFTPARGEGRTKEGCDESYPKGIPDLQEVGKGSLGRQNTGDWR